MWRESVGRRLRAFAGCGNVDRVTAPNQPPTDTESRLSPYRVADAGAGTDTAAESAPADEAVPEPTPEPDPAHPAEPAHPPASPRRRWSLLRVVGVVVLVVALVIAGAVTWTVWASTERSRPGPGIERAMEQMAAEAVEQFPGGAFSYRHDYSGGHRILVEAAIPVEFPLDDAEIERIVEFFEGQSRPRFWDRWTYELDLQLYGGARTLRTSSMQALSDELRLGSGLIDLGFSVDFQRRGVVMAAMCGLEAGECRQEIGEQALAAFDLLAELRSEDPAFRRVDAQLVLRSVHPTQAGTVVLETEVSLGGGQRRQEDGLRQGLRDALQVWATIDPVPLPAAGRIRGYAYISSLVVSSRNGSVEFGTSASSAIDPSDAATDTAIDELTTRVAEHDGETSFRHER